ncbi:MAG: hypothetical protein KGD68_05510 [Candidatus Lokiarchaeota archaeon]|nr:hypothetical protein [Candidatus Lokiarchaeota archaeon]
MISEKEFQNYEEDFYFEEPETIRKEKKVEKIYEIIEQEKIYDIFPNFDLQDEKLTQDILEIYKVLFWGVSALVSTLLWLHFFLT